jgi:cell division septation protein DedD
LIITENTGIKGETNMEKAVVRRGVGAIVLALVAALLLGYLLKGKRDDRTHVVDKQTMPSDIQIFPRGNSSDSNHSATADSGSGVGKAVAVGAIAAAGAAAAGALASSDSKKGSDAVRGSFSNSKDRLTDAGSGNASMGKNRITVDGAGQAIVNNKNAGARETPAQFSIRAPKKNEVRPIVERSTSSKVARSNARLIGEKKLPPVGTGSRKVASSRGGSTSSVSGTHKIASTKARIASTKTPVAAKSTGRNKYSVQLLATSSSGKANSLSSTMKKEGYSTYVKASKKGSGSLYRVRLGNFSGRADAIKKQADLKRRYRKNPYIQSSVVVKQ